MLRAATKTKSVKTMLKRYRRPCITKGFVFSTNDKTKANVAIIHIEYAVGYSQALATMVITANTIIIPNTIHLTVSFLSKECK